MLWGHRHNLSKKLRTAFYDRTRCFAHNVLVVRFYPRGASYARVLAVVVCLSVCLCVCVCLSHAVIVSKRLNLGLCKQGHLIA